MNRIFFKIISIAIPILIAIVIIQSCAVPAMSSKLALFKMETSDNGLIIGSISFPKVTPRFSYYFIRIKGMDSDIRVAEKNSTEIRISPSLIWEVEHNGQLDNGLTYIFAIERPVGVYEIPSIRLSKNNGPFGTSTGYSHSFSIPFDVRKGEITYVGNIIFNEYAGGNDSLVMYRNNFERDIEAIQKMQPTLDWSKATNDSSRKLEYNNNKVKK